MKAEQHAGAGIQIFSARMDPAPAASEGVWEQMRDPASGNVFFANRLLNVTRWDRPPGAPFIPLSDGGRGVWVSPVVVASCRW